MKNKTIFRQKHNKSITTKKRLQTQPLCLILAPRNTSKIITTWQEETDNSQGLTLAAMRQKKDPFCNCNSCSPSFFLCHNLAPFPNLITPQEPTSQSSTFYFMHSTTHSLFYCTKIVTPSKLELFRVVLIKLLLHMNSFLHIKTMLHSTLECENLFHTHLSSTLHSLLHMNLFFCTKIVTHSKLELFQVIIFFNLLLHMNLFFHIKTTLHSTLECKTYFTLICLLLHTLYFI